MTSLRFVGDLPVWAGVLLSVIVAGLSWRYYRRESHDLPGRLRVVLPALRAFAFALCALLLTGPVLQHRTVIGEPGRVQLYVDSSRSMTLHDRHMPAGRKVRIAEALGWLPANSVDDTLAQLAERLGTARANLAAKLRPDPPTDEQATPAIGDTPEPQGLQQAATDFLAAVAAVGQQLDQELAEQFQSELLEPLQATSKTQPVSVDALREHADRSASFEATLRSTFEATVQQQLQNGNETLQAAVTQFDQTPRWRRAEMSLVDSPAQVLQTLQGAHNVEILALAGDRAIPQHMTVNPSDRPLNSSFLASAHADSASIRESFAGTTDLSSGIVAQQAGSGATVPNRTAIVLLTDGRHNAGPSPLQTARVLAAQGLRFYCLSLGPNAPAKDLAVVDLEHPQMVFRKDRVRGAVVIRDDMPSDEPFLVQIVHDDTVLWQEQLTTENSGERRIEFEFMIDELLDDIIDPTKQDTHQHTTTLTLDAVITPLAGESETENNRQSLRLAAITDEYRALILDGRTRWETRYLRNAFERDEQWDVNTVVAGRGTDHKTIPRGDGKDQFPSSREALFEYDVVVFGELSPDLLTDSEFQWLRDFVEVRGGGIVFIDGRRRRFRELTEANLATLLPVSWLPDEITTRPGPLQLTERGAATAALKLSVDVDDNRQLWSHLPPPRSMILVDAQPGAEVLADIEVDGQRRPAIVTRQYGAGRVLYFAFDETWRWRYKSADMWHQRAWHQIARFVMPRPFAVSDEFVSLDTGPVTYDHGDRVDIRTRLLDLNGKPAANATVDALLWKDDRIAATVSLSPDEAVPGTYRGRSGPLPEGDYTVSVRPSGYSDAVMKARTQFVVRPAETGEMTLTSANESLLRQIAAASGGRYLREEDAPQLPNLLEALSNGRIRETSTPLRESYWWFSVIVIVLAAEWMLRKRAGLL